MLDSTASLIFSALPFAWILFYIIALVFVLLRPFEKSLAKRMVTIAFSLMLLSTVTTNVLRFLLRQTLPPSDLNLSYAIISVCSTLTTMIALSLLIAAAFTGRHPLNATTETLPMQDRDSDNTIPYLPPGP